MHEIDVVLGQIGGETVYFHVVSKLDAGSTTR
jgi:hypothetical protein